MKTNWKIAEISEICENYSMFIRVLRGDGPRHAAWRVRLDRRHGAELDDEPRRPRGGRGGRHASLAAKMAIFVNFKFSLFYFITGYYCCRSPRSILERKIT